MIWDKKYKKHTPKTVYISHGGEKQGKSHFGQNQISQNSERYHDGA